MIHHVCRLGYHSTILNSYPCCINILEEWDGVGSFLTGTEDICKSVVTSTECYCPGDNYRALKQSRVQKQMHALMTTDSWSGWQCRKLHKAFIWKVSLCPRFIPYHKTQFAVGSYRRDLCAFVLVSMFLKAGKEQSNEWETLAMYVPHKCVVSVKNSDLVITL